MYKVRPDIVTYNAFLHTCAKGAHVHGCVLVRRAWRMLQVLCLPACLSLCLSVCLSLSFSLSLSISQVSAIGVKVDIYTYNSLVAATAQQPAAGSQQALAAMARMRRDKVRPDVCV